MSRSGNGLAGPFEVRCVGEAMESLKHLQRDALKAGRVDEFLAALQSVYERLRVDPLNFGEPLYRLPALKLSIRVGGVSPLIVSFGVHETRPLVFIRSATGRLPSE